MRESYFKKLKEFTGLQIGWNQLKMGIRATARILAGNVVSHQEYLNRKSICLSCPLRTPFDKSSACIPCGIGGKISSESQRLRSTLKIGYKLDDKITESACGICKCPLATLTLSKQEIIAEKPEQFPDHCWIQEIKNNGPEN